MAGPQLWTTGPCRIYVSIVAGGTAGAFKEFCTAERAPSAHINQAYTPIFNDLGGPAIPFDKSYHRQSAVIRSDATRWDEAVFQEIMSVVNVTPGTEGSNDVGTIILQEGFYLKVKLDFPYSNLAAFAGQPKGYVFAACTLDDIALDPLGTQARKLGCVFTAIEKWNGSGFDFYTIL